MPTSPVCISSGDHRARVVARRDALVVEHLGLVAPIARRIHEKLPPSFDYDDLVAAGNLALVKAAMGYRPEQHGGAPFSAYARKSIEGAMNDTFRANKFAEQTRPSINEPEPRRGNVIEFPCRRPHIDESIELSQRFELLRGHITACLSPLQVRVIDEYYSPAMPNLATVAITLGIKRREAENAHASAIRILQTRLAPAPPPSPIAA